MADRTDATLLVLDAATGQVRRTIPLPYASQPVSLVFDPAGDLYVTLYATGEVVAYDGAEEAQFIARRRHLDALTHDLITPAALEAAVTQAITIHLEEVIEDAPFFQ